MSKVTDTTIGEDGSGSHKPADNHQVVIISWVLSITLQEWCKMEQGVIVWGFAMHANWSSVCKMQGRQSEVSVWCNGGKNKTKQIKQDVH